MPGMASETVNTIPILIAPNPVLRAKAKPIGKSDDAHVRDACARLGAALTINPCPARGMSSSVHVGLTALAGDGPIDGVLVFPVDLPLVRASTLALVAGALGGRADAWARPVFRGESGHPVVLGSGLLPHIIAAGPAITLRDALRSSGGRPVDVECDDPGVTESIDLPDQLRAAERALAVAGSTKA